MTTQEIITNKRVEQYTRDISENTERLANVCLALADTCIKYAGVERVPRYHEQHRENDAEHSLMVGILAIELADELRPDLDKGLLSQYANIHDFIEIKTGDTPTYNLTEAELLDKHQREQQARNELVSTLPPYIGKLVIEYEEQITPESRFTRAVDKLTPLLVDILGPGKMVLREDYGVTTIAQLLQNKQRLDDSMIRRFGEDAPEIVDLYQHLGTIFTEEYKTTEA